MFHTMDSEESVPSSNCTITTCCAMRAPGAPRLWLSHPATAHCGANWQDMREEGWSSRRTGEAESEALRTETTPPQRPAPSHGLLVLTGSPVSWVFGGGTGVSGLRGGRTHVDTGTQIRYPTQRLVAGVTGPSSGRTPSFLSNSASHRLPF